MEQGDVFALIVENDEIAAREIRATLRVERRLRAQIALSAAAARAAVDAGLEPRVFIMELVLPDADGLTLARELRLRFPWKPILIQSAQCSGDIVNSVDRLGARQLCKPYGAGDLVRFVDAARMTPLLEKRLDAVIATFTTAYRLSKRGRDLLALAVRLRDTEQIAKELGVEKSSVESCIRWILAKSGDRNIRAFAQRVWLAAETGAEPSRAEPSRAEPSRAEPSRAEPSRASSGPP